MKKSFRTFLRVANIVVFIVVLLAVSTAGFGLSTGRWSFAVVSSSSMAPTLEIGDLVVSTPIKAKDIKEGDIITFTPPPPYNRETVTHRVRLTFPSENQQIILTKGDANSSSDTWTLTNKPDDIFWGESIVVPKLGHITLFVQLNALLIASWLAISIALVLLTRENRSDKGLGVDIENG